MQKNIQPKIGYYLAGFTDGEGSFNISFHKQADFKTGWKINLCFNISQKDKVILALFKKHLGCGTLRIRNDNIWCYEVNNFNAIKENVIPFFRHFKFLSAQKKRDFAKFCKLATIIENNEHLTISGIKQILNIRKDMNDGDKRKYNDCYILSHLKKSSETTCQN